MTDKNDYEATVQQCGHANGNVSNTTFLSALIVRGNKRLDIFLLRDNKASGADWGGGRFGAVAYLELHKIVLGNLDILSILVTATEVCESLGISNITLHIY